MPASKRLVVDASIARSAGRGEGENPFSAPSRAALNAIEGHHKVVFSEDCFDEWRRHQRDFARRWLRRMTGRKKVIFLREVMDERLRASLAASVEFISEKRAVLKDAHLLEAALQADRIVISRDETVRTLFRQCCPAVKEVRNVLWANPEKEAEEVVPWLEGGARMEPARRLGALVR